MSLRHIIDNKTRIRLLRRLIKKNKFIRVIEAHNGLSALLANDTKIKLETGREKEFDAIWESSLTDSASKGFPDIEVVSFDSRLHTINEILEVTSKPLIVDGDTGGDFNQFEYAVKRLERAGVSMVIIEDKTFPKRNSLEAGTKQDLEKIEVFAEKIKRGQKIKIHKDFMIVARMESLIVGHGIKEALRRARICLKAGADGIMIHSKRTEPTEILEFAKEYYRKFPKKLLKDKVLIAVPTTYNTITDSELNKNGFHIVIHANHLLRSSFIAIENTAKKILLNDRSFEVEGELATIRKIFHKVGFMTVKEKDKKAADKLKSKIKVIIPAAGITDLTKKLKSSISLIDINGKKVLQRQIEVLAKVGIDNIIVVTGFEKDKFGLENLRYYVNKDYGTTGVLATLFKAEREMNGPFVTLFSDVLFNQSIINNLVVQSAQAEADIVLVVDESYKNHRHSKYKKLDLVRTNKTNAMEPIRKLTDSLDEQVVYIGKNLTDKMVHYEFIGIAYFSKKGATVLKEVYHSLTKKRARLSSFTDVVQEIVDRGYQVKILKTYKGWMEIHNEDDIKLAGKFYRNS
ncbi:phosphoenolpyruvate mutase [Candidatus Roizmanbacteria bacterium RIFCSPLOWO2_12_FULL_40_12]|uniref:phosphoenolpyruvate mutase n=1 Tax=Candidatus Roizmanbacteria bacterium RIFCSPLOWO2_01_FULL_40_42 TaxID=1802066 RepID=A0A1F7J5D8_9BACT|nr:MAG: phosphoenolpyruvate mutase [Candidatus Roizmanbacteria bacterium RIFCSPHIGHO2_01_FULL_40_98]OGK28267.1 MAG: phosphoenolpyruvate mutase [Candidatus Roizmanbacteria bacterium RIFCSPHIGHO2_02_FULL_40_53]OGK30503.1 MAG: phosphoenolpyruvate mutase [Candidatus Roizmanbacteria bacterium RIFCSPHIGHO2_12_41_18]OGK36917.1 MAG: phosphoenolpyruvate mutase [Candidatus Roizmanbacteria bacterium RIFCSPHIGHO2_12_FULL_40_130]OGK50823.1 MAG: phosphoenolpyruvate mutase [Candidatus Roizmanbacteria bacteriu